MSEWIDIPEIKDLRVKLEPNKPGFTVSRNITLKEFEQLKEIMLKRMSGDKESAAYLQVHEANFKEVKETATLPDSHPFKKPKDEFEHLAPDHPWRRGTVPVFSG